MRKMKHHLLQLWKDESGQGATEYILLLVVVVAVVLLFKRQIMKAVGDQLTKLEGGMSQVTTDP